MLGVRQNDKTIQLTGHNLSRLKAFDPGERDVTSKIRVLGVCLEPTATAGMALDVGRRAEETVNTARSAFLTECLPNAVCKVLVKRSSNARAAWEAACRRTVRPRRPSNAVGPVTALIVSPCTHDATHPNSRDASSLNGDSVPHVIATEEGDLLLARKLLE